MGVAGGAKTINDDGLIMYLDAINNVCWTSEADDCYNLVGSGTGSCENTITLGENGSFVFDGTDPHIWLPTMNQIVGSANLANYTFELWAKVESGAIGYTGPFGCKDPYWSSNPGGYCLQVRSDQNILIADGTWGASTGDGGVGRKYPALAASTANSENWNHYTITYDGSNTTVYRNTLSTPPYTWGNGVAMNGDLYAKDGTLMLGGIAENNDWDGWLALFKVYKKALSLSELTANYNATKGRFGL